GDEATLSGGSGGDGDRSTGIGTDGKDATHTVAGFPGPGIAIAGQNTDGAGRFGAVYLPSSKQRAGVPGPGTVAGIVNVMIGRKIDRAVIKGADPTPAQGHAEGSRSARAVDDRGGHCRADQGCLRLIRPVQVVILEKAVEVYGGGRVGRTVRSGSLTQSVVDQNSHRPEAAIPLQVGGVQNATIHPRVAPVRGVGVVASEGIPEDRAASAVDPRPHDRIPKPDGPKDPVRVRPATCRVVGPPTDTSVVFRPIPLHDWETTDAGTVGEDRGRPQPDT